MSSLFSELSGLETGALQTAIGIGIGVQAAAALAPVGTGIRQTSYGIEPNLALDPETAARIVAQAIETLGWGEGEAANSGVSSDRFDLLEELEVRAPAVGELLDMIRRSTITGDLVTHGLRKAQLDARYDAAVQQLAERPLEGAELANAIHRGNMVSDGLLLVAAPTTDGNIPQYPVSSLDPVTQAAWSGLSKDQLGVLVANAGLPLALMEMLSLLNRGLVTEDDVKRAVAHSNIRNEYMDVAIDLRRRLLTPHEYAELQLRGYITQADRDAGAALSGMTAADAELLYDVLGRSIPVHQITTGEARGGSYNGATGDIPEAYLSSLQRGNLRPEYYNLAYANRYTIPSYFVLRAIIEAGGLTTAEAADYFTQSGWPPDLAEKAAAAFAGGSTSAADTHVAKAQTQVWTASHKSYVNKLSTVAETTADLQALGVSAAGIPQVLALWDREADIVRRSLTPAQLKKAAGENLITVADATQRLVDLGYTKTDATTLLSE